MRIRPPEFETSICDVKYHVSLALSVIPRGSWGDVARRFTMIRWGPNCYFGLGGPENYFRIIMLSFVNCIDRSDLIVDRDFVKSMSIDDLLATIPHDSKLPSSVGVVTNIKFGKSIEIRGVEEGDCFRRLAVLMLEEIYAKEEQVLTWAQTDSTKIALQRRMYILTKYRGLLLPKFLEARRLNFVAGHSLSAIDLIVLDMLSDLHRVVLEELRTQMQVHGLAWEMSCYSSLFEDDKRDRGAVIARSNTSTRSLCWLRTKIMRQFDDTLAPASEFFKMFHKQWADVCIEAAQFYISGKLQPVGTFNWCKILAVVRNEKVRDVTVDQTEFCGTFRRGLDVQIVLSDSSSSSSSSHELMDFHVNIPSKNEETSVTQFDSLVDPPVSTDTSVDQISLPTAPTTDVAESFTALRASISRIFVNHEKASRSLIKSVRQEAQNQADITSIELKAVRAQNVVLMTDLVDIRKEVRELKAAFSNDILDFRAQAQENYNNLTTQLSELVDYINRGGNDKKEESSSRGPQPPPDDRDISGSGGSDGRNRGGRSESSRKRHYSSGGPHKRDADYWL
ncbi:UDP-glucose flavonoid 3-O-glucosyltransferase 6-like [Dorcoceras hygrometricum]|uniref:UDP-glucose flavonoid 3-O-glucosyltransferase 6-like n=1 Tax=Dorcoceras hygrometricum TaxID=472368 RepID=A0A2Z7BQD9_9LAMI|nr:UDP-glucose flavonoid 3-O-glucosyltransferase 6-like [Dorcoceras hygrometricum]